MLVVFGVLSLAVFRSVTERARIGTLCGQLQTGARSFEKVTPWASSLQTSGTFRAVTERACRFRESDVEFALSLLTPEGVFGCTLVVEPCLGVVVSVSPPMLVSPYE